MKKTNYNSNIIESYKDIYNANIKIIKWNGQVITLLYLFNFYKSQYHITLKTHIY